MTHSANTVAQRSMEKRPVILATAAGSAPGKQNRYPYSKSVARTVASVYALMASTTIFATLTMIGAANARNDCQGAGAEMKMSELLYPLLAGQIISVVSTFCLFLSNPSTLWNSWLAPIFISVFFNFGGLLAACFIGNKYVYVSHDSL